MRNRKIVEFVLYPRLFHSLCILYKGTYCLSFKIYNLTEGGTTTYAFPSIVNHPQPQHDKIPDASYEPASLHQESNFSYETERFSIIYEEDRKILRTQGLFRLQYQQGKIYSTFLSCKLLKKIKSQRKLESNFCTRAISDNSYETVDTQIFKLNSIDRLNHYQKVFFHSTEFFSSIDFCLTTFDQGIKSWKSKSQLSDLLSGYTLSKCDPLLILQAKVKEEERKKLKLNSKNMQSAILQNYNKMDKMIEQYRYWYEKVLEFRKYILADINRQGKSLAPLTLADLSHLSRNNRSSEAELRFFYECDTRQETLSYILEEKQALHYNIRAIRIYFSMILFHESERKFTLKVKESQEEQELTMQQKFICFQPHIREIVGEQRRSTASIDFSKEILLSPVKLERMPFLLVEGYERPLEIKARHKFTLTVFVHGYQGNSFDFQKSKSYLKRFNKSTTVLVIESITKEMEKSIQQLGKKVAEQVVRHVQNSIIRYQWINFVGFSLGGLLVRACLSSLGQLRKRLGIFVTFSSPHLGISESQNSLVKLGVWYLIKVDKVKNLKELNFQSVDFNDSVLTKLSKCPHIASFKRVILVSSKDDGFVPLYSTFLDRDLCQNEILGLCNNLLSHIRKLQRVEVLFNVQHAGTLDKLTGRRGHIQFLDNHYFLQLFFRLYGPYF